MAIEKITAEQRELMKRKSAQALPDVPSGKGWTPRQFKDAVTKPLFDNENSFYAHINRIAEQLDLDKFNKEDYDINKTWYDVEEYFADHCISHMKTYPNDRKIFFASIGDTETIRYECVGLVKRDIEEGTYSCVVVSPSSIQTYEMSSTDDYPRKVSTSFDTLNLLGLNVVGEITAGEPKSSRGVVTRNYLMNNYYDRQDTDTNFVDVHNNQNIYGKKLFADKTTFNSGISTTEIRTNGSNLQLGTNNTTIDVQNGKVVVNGQQLISDYDAKAYTDNAVRQGMNELVDNAPDALNTFKEIAQYIEEDKSGAKQMESSIQRNSENIAQLDSKKANRSELFNKDYNELVNKPDEALVILRDYVSDDTNKPAKEIELNGEKWALTAELDQISNITYQELVELRNQGNLIKGRQYRIIDYVTTTAQDDTRSAEHQFDIIVTADDNKTLNEKARAIQHEGDEYFANSRLNAWELWYCLDNDFLRFEWADEENGKGVIYRMIDEFGNNLPYDFKNILFFHPTIVPEQQWWHTFSALVSHIQYNQWGSTFSVYRNPEIDTTHQGVQYYGYSCDTKPTAWGNENFLITDSEIKTTSIMYNTEFSQLTFGGTLVVNEEHGLIETSRQGKKYVIYNNFFAGDFTHQTMYPDGSNGVHVIQQRIKSNIFTGNYIYENTFGATFYGNVFRGSVFNNVFGNDCYENSFTNTVSNNKVSGSFYRNTFNGFDQNEIGNYMHDNVCNEYFANNVIDDNCANNTIEGGFTFNTCKDGFSYNTIKGNCSSNLFGETFFTNYIGGSITHNSFGGNCQNNYICEGLENSSFGNGCKYVLLFYRRTGQSAIPLTTPQSISNYILENGVSYVQITDMSSTGSTGRPTQNIKLCSGFTGSSWFNLKTVVIEQDKVYQQVYKIKGSTETEAELVI